MFGPRIGAAVVAVLCGPMSAFAAEGIQFIKDLPTAQAAAARSGMPMMVEITGPG